MIFPYHTIKEKNGKTIKENNLEVPHNIPLGTLVHCKWDKWMRDGCSARVEARLYVTSLDRDCNGAPLYSLGCVDPTHPDTISCAQQTGMTPTQYALYYSHQLGTYCYGLAEEKLTPVEKTPETMSGDNALTWEENLCS